MSRDIWNISNMNEIYEIKANIPYFPYLKNLQPIDPWFVTITKQLDRSKILWKIEMIV